VWYIVSLLTYSTKKYHRVFLDPKDGRYYFKCNTWYAGPLGKMFKLESQDEVVLTISEKQLCGRCFNRPRPPKVKVTAKSGRVS
jgi:hypothetical protein